MPGVVVLESMWNKKGRLLDDEPSVLPYLKAIRQSLAWEGIRVNLVSAGPLRTLAAKAIPGFSDLEDMWTTRAPLGWDNADHEPTAKAICALLSDLFPATT